MDGEWPQSADRMSVSRPSKTNASEEPYNLRVGFQEKHCGNTLLEGEWLQSADRMSVSRPSKTDASEEPYKLRIAFREILSILRTKDSCDGFGLASPGD